MKKSMAVYDSALLPHPTLYELSQLAQYRLLLRNLISRNLKVRYKRSVLGFAWAMLNPLLTMLVLTVVFSTVFRTDVTRYPLHVLGGLFIWQFFSHASVTAMSSILENANLLTKVYVPPSIFVIAAVGSALANLLFALVPLLGLAILLGALPTPIWLFIIVPIAQVALLSLGVGLILSSITVYFRDLIDIYQVLLSLLFYLTPIVYPASILPEPLTRFLAFNPLYHILVNIRIPLLEGKLPPLESILYGTLIPLVLLLCGWIVFNALKMRFSHQL